MYLFFFFTKVPFNAKKYVFSHSSVPFQNFSLATLLYMHILFIFGVAILKIIYNMASGVRKLTVKVTGRMDDPPFNLTLISILLGTP